MCYFPKSVKYIIIKDETYIKMYISTTIQIGDKTHSHPQLILLLIFNTISINNIKLASFIILTHFLVSANVYYL